MREWSPRTRIPKADAREALAPYDTLTVGECSGVTLEEAKRYANADGSELNMVFQFEHTDMDFLDLGHKWGYQKVSLPRLKEILSRWQVGLHGMRGTACFGKITTSRAS